MVEDLWHVTLAGFLMHRVHIERSTADDRDVVAVRGVIDDCRSRTAEHVYRHDTTEKDAEAEDIETKFVHSGAFLPFTHIASNYSIYHIQGCLSMWLRFNINERDRAAKARSHDEFYILRFLSFESFFSSEQSSSLEEVSSSVGDDASKHDHEWALLATG